MAYQKLEVDFGVWGTVRKVVFGTILAAFLFAFTLWYGSILKQSGALEKEIEIKRQALTRQKEVQTAYQEEILALRTDPDAVEHAARETLKLNKPNETIYRFDLRDSNK